MIKCSRLEEYKNIEEKITKDVRKLFRLKIKKKKEQIMPQLKVLEIFLD